jgi:transposase
MEMGATVKACEPVKVPLCVLEELQGLRAELARLRQEVADLRQDNDRLRQDNERLRQDNERLRQDNERLHSERDQAQRQARRQAAPFSKGPPNDQPRRPGRKPGQSHGRHGHRPPPAPEQIDQVLDAPLPDACPHCGGAVEQTEVKRQYQTEIPRRPLIRQFNVHIGCCAGCGARLQGRHPLQTSDALGAAASQLGPDAQAAVALLNKKAGLPHGKIAFVLEGLFGIRISRGASVQIVLRAGQRLGPAQQEVLGEVKDSVPLTPDETGWRLGGKPAWLHAWVAERATAYAIDRRRSAWVLERVIGKDWDGFLVHDGMSSYDRFEQASHQQCLAHLLRRVRQLEAGASRGAVHYPRRLIGLFTEALQLRERYRRGEVAAEALQEARRRFDERLERLARPRRVVPAYETLSRHLWKHLGEWFTFLEHPWLEATNWQAEQAIRPAVVNRKVWGGNRTPAGARAQEVLMSVLETARRAGHNLLDFVSATLRSFANPNLTRPLLLATR